MDPSVFAAVLLAAALHAGWNALLKSKLEPLKAITLVSIGAGVFSAPLLAVAPMPDPAAWPYLIGSLVLHLGYYTALAEGYRTGDLGQVYPIARGTAPLMTAVGATAILGENLGAAGWSGIGLLATGVVAISLRGGRDARRFEVRAVGFALLTAATIAAYTLVDGVGARSTAEVLSYIAWLFVLDGVMMLIFGLIAWRGGLLTAIASAWHVAVIGGAMSAGAYAIALWAMTKAPIALVAALRETSVLFAALIGMAALREPVLPVRLFAAALVLAGVVMLRLR